MDQAFGQSIHTVEELSDGWANVAYVVQLNDGKKVVLKVAPSQDKQLMRTEKNNMQTEVEAMRMVANMGDIPVPYIYTYDPDRRLIPSEYFIMEFIEGTPLNKVKEVLSKEELEGIQRQIGEYSQRINACKGEKFGYLHDGDQLMDSWTEAFRRMIDDVIADGRDLNVELPISYSDIEKEIEKRMYSLQEVTQPSLVHWDLWDGNVFIHKGEISAIVDFERAFWGDPLIEYYFGKFGGSAAFDAGYGRGIVTEGEQVRRDLYDLYLDLILVIECDYRKYEDQNHIQWTRDNFAANFKILQNK